MSPERRTNSSVRRPDASWRHTTNHKFATETRAICWLVGVAQARHGNRGKSSKDLSRETATRPVTLKRREPSCSRQTYHAGRAMSEKGNVLCCFLSTCLHFLPNFRRCDARQAARPWPAPQICWDSSSCGRRACCACVCRHFVPLVLTVSRWPTAAAGTACPTTNTPSGTHQLPGLSQSCRKSGK
jgi:hypothetical protein